MAAWRYWRIYITANNGGLATSIQEIELRGTIGGPDLTTPSTPADQSRYFYFPSEGYDNRAFRLVDNDFTDFAFKLWVNDAENGNPLPDWVYFDLGTPTTVAELAMWPQARSDLVNRAPKDFLIQGSSDALAWSTEATFSGITGWSAGTGKTFAVGSGGQSVNLVAAAAAQSSAQAGLQHGVPLAGAAQAAAAATANLKHAVPLGGAAAAQAAASAELDPGPGGSPKPLAGMAAAQATAAAEFQHVTPLSATAQAQAGASAQLLRVARLAAAAQAQAAAVAQITVTSNSGPKPLAAAAVASAQASAQLNGGIGLMSAGSAFWEFEVQSDYEFQVQSDYEFEVPL